MPVLQSSEVFCTPDGTHAAAAPARGARKEIGKSSAYTEGK